METSINIRRICHKYSRTIFLTILLNITLFIQPALSEQQYRYRIEYSYEGEFGMYGIADIASAYYGSVLIAKAKAVRIIKKNPGPNHIEIEETHFNPSGDITYRGKLIFQFGFGGGHIVEEKAISSIKRYQIFTGWPAGN